jgi:enolase-phosphatase E1
VHLKRPRCILSDIEGTTSSLSFVKEVLFPYSARRLERFVLEHAEEAEVKRALAEAAATIGLEGANKTACSHAEVLDALTLWIEQDRKHTGLKRLQGLIWKEGFERGEFRGHLYADVAPAFRAWHAAGIRLGIYSSGSVQAQQVYFGYSDAGDLRPLLSAWFDTENAGGKRLEASYRVIEAALAIPATDILFLSDIGAELDAAASAGFATVQLIRGDFTTPASGHLQVASFIEVGFE